MNGNPADKAKNPKGFWQKLAVRLDFSKSQPRLRPGWEEVRFVSRDGKDYYVVRSPKGRGYIRLSVKDYFLFSLMDGSRMVQEILVEYFRRFGTLAFSRLGTLIQELFKGGFLSESPRAFYSRLLKVIRTSQPLPRLLESIKALPRKQWPIPDLDRWVGMLYQGGFKVFFYRPIQLAAGLVALAGMVVFLKAAGSGKYTLLESQGSIGMGLVLLVALNYVAIISHELSHALACKHYGRRVNSGGLVINTIFPSFYVDVTDSWMLPKKARMVVSLIGPFSQAFVAGAMSFLILLSPDSAASHLLYKFALLSYLTVFINLSPLWELDGYYVLMDWLELPGLKAKAASFVRKDLRARLRAKEPLSREERIYTAFGLGSLAWSALALLLVGYFWRIQALRMGSRFFNAAGDQLKLVVGVLALFLVLGAVIAAFQKIKTLAVTFWKALTGRIYRQPGLMAGILFGLCLLAALAYGWLGTWAARTAALLVALGLGALSQRVYSYYRGSSLWLVLLGLLAAALGSLSLMMLPAAVRTATWLAGSAALFAATYTQFSYSSLRRWRQWQRVLWGALWLGVLVLAALYHQRSSLMTLSVLLSSAALLMVLSLVWNNLGSSLEYFWSFFLLGVASWVVSLMYHLPGAGFLTSLLLLFAVFWLYLIIKSARWLPESSGFESTASEKRRMRQAAVRIYRMSRSYFASFFGEGQARAMDDRLNLVMVQKRWPIRLYGDGSEERFERSVGIVERSQAYQGLLDEILNYLIREVGDYFARHAIRTAYESLYWEEREVAQQYLMKGAGWAEGLSRERFGKERRDAQNVISGVAGFWELDEQETAMFYSRLREEKARSGQVIIRQGDQGDKFYIIKSGQAEVVVSRSGEPELSAAVLSRGDYFGEIALVKNVPRTATVRALTDCSLLVLERRDFEDLMASKVDLGQRIDRLIENRGFLVKLPLFAEFAPAQVAMAASRLIPERYREGQAVIRQNEIGDSFFIIREGRLEVVVEREGRRNRVAELGPGEYFGEIALLLDVPRTADVVALTDCLVLRLRKDDFRELMGEQLYFAQSLERTSSRRMSDTRHKTN